MKYKTIGILSLMTAMFFAASTPALAGDFLIQNYTFGVIFSVDNATGNVNVTGEIYENATPIKETYWQIANAGTPADGSDDNVSTANQIYDWVTGWVGEQGYTTTAWNNLANITLIENYMLVGNSSNQPTGVAISGDITINSTGYVTVGDGSHVHAGENITTGTVAEARIDALIARDSEVVTVNTSMRNYVDGINMLANVTGTITNTKYCTYNSSNSLINCESEGAGLINVVEDLTPQLGGNLDVNDFGIDGGGDTNMTIDATGNLIIVLA